ncbi:DUF3016 domain-containing protein [Coralloluteibacterium thermophilus]|uniref:DUF3016 domain-containing protein n=1 Tax=Coralloluteibacterium thermophilum TaxID=2707049 RepID=A0ABV9NPV9_9GAMM
MRRLPLLTPLLALALLTGCASGPTRVTDADAPRSLAGEGPVQVRWDDPEAFSEIRLSGNRWEAARGNWVERLAEHVRDRAAPRLAPGQRLDVTFHDIRRAGNYEPWRGPQADRIRYVRDIYPPRVDLSFRLTGADGSVLAEGERRLSDPGFLTGASTLDGSDTLRFEKRLLDRWIQREFPRS